MELWKNIFCVSVTFLSNFGPFALLHFVCMLSSVNILLITFTLSHSNTFSLSPGSWMCSEPWSTGSRKIRTRDRLISHNWCRAFVSLSWDQRSCRRYKGEPSTLTIPSSIPYCSIFCTVLRYLFQVQNCKLLVRSSGGKTALRVVNNLLHGDRRTSDCKPRTPNQVQPTAIKQ